MYQNTSNREKILIDEMKSSIEIIVVNEGNSHKRRRTRTYFKYVITPKGIAERTKLTINYMKRKMKEYDELKKELDK